MTVATRTPEEIYAEINALMADSQPWRKDMTTAEKIAWTEAGIVRLAREEELWRELGRAIPVGAPAWQFTAAMGAREAAFEKSLRWQERLERYQEQAKEEK